MGKNYRYVPKNLSPEQLKKVEKVKGLIQQMVDSTTTFEDRKKVIYKGIDILFHTIATIEEYEKGERKPKTFEAEEYDIESFGDISSYSPECIDTVISELGFGTKTSDIAQIERDFKLNAGEVVNTKELGRLKQQSLGKNLTKEQLEFMKKTHFVSEFFKEQQKSTDCEENISLLKTNTEQAENYIQSNNNTILSKGQVLINGTPISTIATEYINDLVMKSYEKAMKDSHYAPIVPSENPDMSIVCGLPGLGKSSIFINDLKKQGTLCVDLDDIAISISKRFNVPINDATSNDLYKLANMVHDTVVAQSMMQGYNIAIEKIGYDKKQITEISDNMYDIAGQVSDITGKHLEYNQSLLMAAGSSVASAESNSIRNAEQIFSGSDLRGYHYASLLRNNNCTTYAYMSVLSDERLRSRFSQIRISDRQGCYEGLSLSNGKCLAIENAKKSAKKDGRIYECQ